MIIYDNKGDQLLDIPVDDDSYRYRAIRQGDRVYLHFSLTGHVEIPLYSYIEHQGERYILWKPENLTKHFSRNIEYSAEFGGWWGLLERTRYKLLSDKPHKLRFSLSATPKTFMGLLVDNLNQRDSGWTLGVCVEAGERLLSFSHESCMAALDRLADEYDTEWEITGKTISLRKVERFKDEPVALSYGRGNGFKSGVGRTNQGDKAPVTILYVQGGDRNIDRLKYGGDTLLLPRSQELAYQGRRYRTDADGMYVTRADKALAVFNEDGYDAGDIYPSRVGEVTGVRTEPGKDTEGNPVTFYDIADTTIPAALDYRDCRLDGNKATVIFQSGKLAGREFDIVQTEKDLTGYDHATRTFKLVSIQEDGMTLPNDRLCPSIGDKYAVFNISLPAAYVCDDTTKTGASWDMFREAARYMYENEDEAFTFKGDLDGIWARKRWLEIGGKLVPGGHVEFSDGQFQPEGVRIRITGIKDYINRPYSPEIELSNVPVAGLVSSGLGKIDANEKTDEDNHRKSLQFTKRSFRDAKETMGMLADALLTNFTESVNPVAVATMQLLVGDESLQFRFVSGRTNPVAVDDGIRYDKGRKVLSIPAGVIQHMTLGIKDISPRHEYKFWDIGSYGSPYLDPGKKFYLYAKCSGSNQSGTFLVSEKAIGMGDVSGFYHLLVGVLNGEYDGERSLTTLYGYTEVLPGRVTTDRIVSTDGNTYFDLSRGEIGGRITFASGSSGLDNLAEWPAASEAIQDSLEAYSDGVGDSAKESLARGLGYDSYAAMEEAAKEKNTIIEGGKIKTSLIDTDTLVAKHIDVDDGRLGGFYVNGKILVAIPKTGTCINISETNGYVWLGLVNGNDMLSVGCDNGAKGIKVAAGNGSKGIYVDSSTSEGIVINSHGGDEIALRLESGCVAGLRVKTMRVATSYTVKDIDNFISCYPPNNITITLPASPRMGDIKLIRRNTEAIININGNGNKIRTDGLYDSIGLGEGIGDMGLFLFDGLYWTYNVLFR